MYNTQLVHLLVVKYLVNLQNARCNNKVSELQYLSLLLHPASCRFTKYNTTNKCTCLPARETTYTNTGYTATTIL